MFSSSLKINPFPIHAGRPASVRAERVERRADRATRHRLLVVAAGLALLMLTLTLLPAMAVGAQSGYPANTVVSTYFDPRYGEVSVVTDASGNLIDVNAATGQRIYPVYPDYASAYTNVYAAPAYVSANSYGYATASTYSTLYGSRQYTDNNSNCANGQVTQTASGYYCTATGAPAFRTA